LLLALLVGQVVFGVSIIWTYRSPLPVTLHVVSGAALLATCLLIALRSSCAPVEACDEFALPHPVQQGAAS
jgi:heme A synthase